MSRDDATLLDMATAARKAVEFCEGTGRDDFLADEKTQSAVLHKLLVLGEAAKRISPAFAAKHPKIPWRFIAGMRDRLIHAYDATDIEEVWSVVERDLPVLLGDIEPLLPSRK